MAFWEKNNNYFEKLFLNKKHILAAIAFDIIHDSFCVDEVLSEVYLAVSKNPKVFLTLDEKKQVHYLCNATRNRAINIYHKNRHIQEKEMAFEDFPFSKTTVSLEHVIISKETLAEIKTALSQLREEYRAVLELSVYYQLSDKEIGEYLGITENLVRVRKHRGREKLKTKLGEEGYFNA